MINALMLLAGATVFMGGFYMGMHLDFPKKPKENCKVTGDVIFNKDYQNFLKYDGTEQE